MIRDDFDRDRSPGGVIGTAATAGGERLGIDAEGTMAIDNGALRIGFLERPGWGREAIAYGPFERRSDLALSVLALNGHNASQVHAVPIRHRHRPAWLLRRLLRPSSLAPHHLDRSFAVGWAADRPEDGEPRGSLLAVSQVIGENADLCGSILGEYVPLVRRLRNVPILYVVVLRSRGAIYYGASLPDVPGLPALPSMRPLAIDPGGEQSELLATVHQSVLAEVGWRVDSRVSAVRVGEVPPANVMTGSEMEDAEEPSGLLYARILKPAEGGGFVWRADSDGDGFTLTVGAGGVTLNLRQEGAESLVAADPAIVPVDEVHLQVLDDGEEITVLVDAEVAFGGPIRDARFADATWAGRFGAVADFEVHPRVVPIPAALEPDPPWDQRGDAEVLVDRFEGPVGELGPPWTRRVGTGRILLTGSGGAKVDADRERPNPGRVLYTLPWSYPEFAEFEIDQTPPGQEGEGENGRAGLVLMQDPDNYLIINTWLDDVFPGTSVSSFLTLDGHEDHFRAVWCNVGRMIRWGISSRLSIASDGMRWTVRVDGVPVLHRALSDVCPNAPRLRIAEVGIAVNWEYGDDTGTQVHEFRARRGRR